MPCARCHGLLVAADLVDGIGSATATRCLMCGDLTDPLILQHRAHRPEPYSEANPKPFDPTSGTGAPLA